MPFALVAAGGYLLTQIRQRQRLLFYAMFCVSYIGSAWASRLHGGAYHNVLIPAHVCLSVMLGLAVHESPNLARPSRAALVRTVMAVLCLLQFFQLRYDPSTQVPNRRQAELQNRLVRLMADADGDVFVSHHGFFPVLAGKQPNAHAVAFRDILLAGGPLQHDLLSEARDALHAQRFALIVLDAVDPWLEPELSWHYQRIGPVFEEEGLWTVTGIRTRPRWVYAPKAFATLERH